MSGREHIQPLREVLMRDGETLTLVCGHTVKRKGRERFVRRARCIRCLAATVDPATVTEVCENGAKKFRPPVIEGAGEGAFYFHEWLAYREALTEAEYESLRAKARWEHMTLSAVAREWGALQSHGEVALGAKA